MSADIQTRLTISLLQGITLSARVHNERTLLEQELAARIQLLTAS